MKVEMSLAQYATIKSLFKAASTDSKRRNLQGVYYDAVLQQCVACDGHVLRIEKMDLGAESGIFKRCDFAFKESDIIEKYDLEEGSEGYTPFEHDIGLIKEEYVSYTNVIPDEKDCRPIPCIGLKAKILKKLMASFAATDTVLAFFFVRSTGAVIVKNESGEFCGLLMPARLPGIENDLAQMEMRFEITDRVTGEIVGDWGAGEAETKNEPEPTQA